MPCSQRACSLILSLILPGFMRKKVPSTMLAVYRHESSDLHCSVMVYLTADFQRASLLDNAIHCPMPAMSDAGFLAGNKASMKQ